MPADPLGPRQQAVTAWTGHELLAVGGSSVAGNGPGLTGADAYDPRTRAWRQLPDFPLAARGGVASTWTGYGLVLWGGETNPGGERALTRPLGDGAILDVAEAAMARPAFRAAPGIERAGRRHRQGRSSDHHGRRTAAAGARQWQ